MGESAGQSIWSRTGDLASLWIRRAGRICGATVDRERSITTESIAHQRRIKIFQRLWGQAIGIEVGILAHELVVSQKC
jgi:hypothetical protein